MARQSRSEYKPLLFTTTMRNPGRLKYMLYVLNKFEGQILDDELATKICGETIRYGLYRPMKKLLSVQTKWATSDQGEFSETLLTDDEVNLMLHNNPQSHKEAGFAKGWPSRFATIYDLTKELGLAYFNVGEPIVISPLCKHLLQSLDVNIDEGTGLVSYEIVHPEYEQQVFTQALAKSQRHNPFVRVLNDNIPLILLLQTIQKLNADPEQNGAGISRRELPLLIFWKDNDAEALYQRIARLRKEYGYTPSDEVICDICLEEIMEGNFKKFKTESIMDEYPDEFIRKMRMTGLISLRGAGRYIDINKNESDKIKYILTHYANYSHFNNERDYFDYMAELDENLISIESETPSLSESEELLSNWLSTYKWNTIKQELTNLATRKPSNDAILKFLAAPVRLEFLTALAIKSKIPDVRVIPNYACDDTGLPTSTAGGNKGDIECFEHQYGVLVEVTMATGRTQTMMEIWPIERHLTDFQKKQPSQCIFVAPSIYADSKRQIKYVSDESKGVLKIRPYDITELVTFLENSHGLYEYKITSLFDSPKMVSYADQYMKLKRGIDILSLTRALQGEFGEDYGSMGAREWYVVTREYVERQTMRNNIPDDEPVSWLAAEDLA